MIKLKLALEPNYEMAAPGCDFIFNIHAAHTSCLTILAENLHLSPMLTMEIYRAPQIPTRRLSIR